MYEAWVNNFRSVICSFEQLRRLQTHYHPDRVSDTPLVPLHTRISQFLNAQMEERRACGEELLALGVRRLRKRHRVQVAKAPHLDIQ